MIQGWLGSVGRMQPVYSTPGMSTTPEVARTYTDTLGGRRFVRSAPRGHRTWELSGSAAEGADLAVPALFASGAWGPGPWWWLSPWAVTVNALTPDGSLLAWAHLAGATLGGPAQVEGGLWLPSSAVTTGTVNAIARTETAGYIPVPARTPYTAGLHVAAGMQVRVTEFGADLGLPIRSVSSPAAAPGPLLSRVTVSSVASATTAALRVDVVGAGQCAGASLTLTPTPQPWALGDGCQEAVVDQESRDVRVLTASPWADQSYTIKEVG